MAIRRYLYPPEGTNIPKLTQFFTSVACSNAGVLDQTTKKGFGVTVTKDGVTAGLYHVTFDNSGTVAAVLDCEVKLVTGASYDPTKVCSCKVKSVSTTGFDFETIKPSDGSVANPDIAGTFLVAVSAQTSGVKA